MNDQSVLFDLDGTLIDTVPDFIASCHAICEQDHLPKPSDAAIKATVSQGVAGFIQLLYGTDVTPSHADTLKLQFLDYYQQQCGLNAKLFDGLRPCLEFLNNHDIPWGVVTNKPIRFTALILERLALEPPSSVIVCPDHVSEPKPSPEGLLLAARQLGIEPAQCIYAGDHQRDILAGQHAGMHTIACAFGYLETKDDPQQWHANTIVYSPHELTNYLLSLLSTLKPL